MNVQFVEQRAAEIVASILTEYFQGGWFAMMTRGERWGWDIHEWEWWTGKEHSMPRNDREWAGWLAREMMEGQWETDVRAGGAA